MFNYLTAGFHSKYFSTLKILDTYRIIILGFELSHSGGSPELAGNGYITDIDNEATVGGIFGEAPLVTVWVLVLRHELEVSFRIDIVVDIEIVVDIIVVDIVIFSRILAHGRLGIAVIGTYCILDPFILST
jgi:hypothetical protein